MPRIKLTLLVGLYAQRAYLPPRIGTLTETVHGFAAFPPAFFPLPHPSWRSTGWMRRNPWFESDVLPALHARLSAALS